MDDDGERAAAHRSCRRLRFFALARGSSSLDDRRARSRFLRPASRLLSPLARSWSAAGQPAATTTICLFALAYDERRQRRCATTTTIGDESAREQRVIDASRVFFSSRPPIRQRRIEVTIFHFCRDTRAHATAADFVAMVVVAAAGCSWLCDLPSAGSWRPPLPHRRRRAADEATRARAKR